VHVRCCDVSGMMGMMPMMRPPGIVPAGMMPPPAGVAMPPFRPPSSQVALALLFLNAYIVHAVYLIIIDTDSWLAVKHWHG